MDADSIATVLDEIAAMLDLQGESTFKILAYRNGAAVVRDIAPDLPALIDAGTLTEIDGIGDALATKITDLAHDRPVDLYERLKADVPGGLVEMLKVPGLGAAKVKLLHRELGVTSVEELKAACGDGRVSAVKGFGAKSVEQLEGGISWLERRRDR